MENHPCDPRFKPVLSPTFFSWGTLSTFKRNFSTVDPKSPPYPNSDYLVPLFASVLAYFVRTRPDVLFVRKPEDQCAGSASSAPMPYRRHESSVFCAESASSAPMLHMSWRSLSGSRRSRCIPVEHGSSGFPPNYAMGHNTKSPVAAGLRDFWQWIHARKGSFGFWSPCLNRPAPTWRIKASLPRRFKIDNIIRFFFDTAYRMLFSISSGGI